MSDTPGIGHNTKGISAHRLKSFIERIERLESEKAGLGADVREVYGEAKSSGFDPKIMRQVIKIRKMDPSDHQENESLLAVYLDVVGEVSAVESETLNAMIDG